jgi:hypothetical protein
VFVTRSAAGVAPAPQWSSGLSQHLLCLGRSSSRYIGDSLAGPDFLAAGVALAQAFPEFLALKKMGLDERLGCSRNCKGSFPADSFPIQKRIAIAQGKPKHRTIIFGCKDPPGYACPNQQHSSEEVPVTQTGQMCSNY